MRFDNFKDFQALNAEWHQSGISNGILSVLLHHETLRPIAKWFKSFKLSQLFSRRSKYIRKLPKLSQKLSEIVILKVEAFWRVYQNWVKVPSYIHGSCYKTSMKPVNICHHRNTMNSTSSFLCRRDREEELLPHLRLTHSAFACWWHVKFLCFYQRNFRYGPIIFYCCEIMPVSLFLNDNAENGEQHNILWGFNAVERLFVIFFINFF